jgi:general secretion pathway protein G
MTPPTESTVPDRRFPIGVVVALALLALPFILSAFLIEVRTIGSAPGPAARRARVRSDLQNILGVARTIQGDTGRLPASLEEMVQDGCAPLDPWGNLYDYRVGAGGGVTVRSLGSDGAPGGEGEAADTVRSEGP